MVRQEDFSDMIGARRMPGQMLKAAREAQDITVEEVGKQLHLTVPTILSIEADQYQNMPAPVYVRGYLRRYAQLVKLSADDIVKAFDQNVEMKSQIIEEMPSPKKKLITSSHKGFRLLTYGIIVLLLILVGLWWKGQDHVGTPEKQDKQDTSEIKTRPSRPIQLEPVKPETSQEKSPASALPEKNTLESTTQSPLILNSDQADQSNKASKIKPSSNSNSGETSLERRYDVEGMPKEKNVRKISPRRQPSNALDVY